MANKKTTTKKSVKKKTRSQLKVTKGKGTKATRDRPSARKTSPQPIEVEPIVSSAPNPVHSIEPRSNSYPSKVANKSKKALVIKDKLEWGQVVTCLEDILAGLKAETLCLQQGNEFVTLRPHSMIEVEIEASVKKNKERFVLKLTWRSERDDEGTGFCILSS